MTVTTLGSASASTTLLMSLRAVSAPVGQCVMHCPHSAHFASEMGRPSFTVTFICWPVPVKSHTEQCWTSEQMATQRMHLMHFEASRCSGKSSSQSRLANLGSKGSFSTLNASAMRRSAHVSVRSQLVHSVLCSERIISRFRRRARTTCGVFVWTTMPSATGVLHDAHMRSSPSTCTTQTRHAPIWLIFSRKHSVGILMPSSSAALRMVVPSGTETCWLSIVSVTICGASLHAARPCHSGRSAGSARIPAPLRHRAAESPRRRSPCHARRRHARGC